MEDENKTKVQPEAEETVSQPMISKERTDQLVSEVKKAANEMVNAAKSIKEKYDKSDETTKKKVMAGIIGVFAIILGIIGIKKAHNKHRD
jgi:parvulin-like peptidyl-prolyl isomerase